MNKLQSFTDETDTHELRAMIGNVAHDLKTVSYCNYIKH